MGMVFSINDSNVWILENHGLRFKMSVQTKYKWIYEYCFILCLFRFNDVHFVLSSRACSSINAEWNDSCWQTDRRTCRRQKDHFFLELLYNSFWFEAWYLSFRNIFQHFCRFLSLCVEIRKWFDLLYQTLMPGIPHVLLLLITKLVLWMTSFGFTIVSIQ